MSPNYYSRFAARAFPIRWWLGAWSLCGFALMALLGTQAGGLGFRIATVIAGPVIGLPWAALCATIWFHPVRGNMVPASRFVGRLPMTLQAGIRWYPAIFLSIFALACAVAWPLFALSSQ